MQTPSNNPTRDGIIERLGNLENGVQTFMQRYLELVFVFYKGLIRQFSDQELQLLLAFAKMHTDKFVSALEEMEEYGEQAGLDDLVIQITTQLEELVGPLFESFDSDDSDSDNENSETNAEEFDIGTMSRIAENLSYNPNGS